MRKALFAGLMTTALAGSTAAQAPLFPSPRSESATYAGYDTPTKVSGDTIEELTAERILMAPKFWVAGEYQILWAQNANVPQIIERIPAQFASGGGNSFPANVRVNEFPTRRDIRYDSINAYRVSAGVRIQPQLALDGNYFTTETANERATVSGSGLPGTDGISRSYTQAGTGNQISLFAAQPGQYSGSVTAHSNMQAWGVDSNLRWDTYHIFVDRTELLAGFRYFNLGERISIDDSSTFSDGRRLAVSDNFQTRNHFYGGQVGFHSRIYGTVWSLDFINKYAIGGVNQEVRAFGSNSIISPAGVEDREQGGLYARGANVGTFSRNRFAVAAESSTIVGYNLTPNVRLHFGYHGSWISSVIRAPEVIDPVVNDSNVRYISLPSPSNANRPAFQWNRASDYFLQGVSFGVTAGY